MNGQRSLVSLAIGLVAGLALGGGAAYYYFGRPATPEGGGERGLPPATATRVTARGRLEPEGGLINLAAPGPDVLEKILVKEGASVEKDQELAVLASQKLRKIENDSAQLQVEEAEDRRQKSIAHLKAQLKESDTKIQQLRTQGPLDEQVQQAKIEVLRRQLATADELLMRMRRAGTYAQQELDQQQLIRDQAEQELNGAKVVLTKIQDANKANMQAAEAQRDVIVADLNRAQSELPVATLKKSAELAAERYKQTSIRSPIQGKVLKVLARAGELVGTQPVFQLGDASSMVAVAEVYETDVKAVRDWDREKPGQVEADVEIRFPGGGSAKYRGKVIQIANVVGKNTTFSVDPRQEFDRRVVEVRIRLNSTSAQQAAEYINMQVDVTINDPKAPK